MPSNKPKFSEKRQNVILVQDRISRTSKHSLRPALRCRRITPYSKDIQPIPKGSVAINFGGGAFGTLPGVLKRAVDEKICVILNPPDKVAISSNKLRTFELFAKSQVPTVRWTVDKGEAGKWLGKGHKVLCRMALASSGGRGIRVLEAVGDIPDAPLFTRYFPKTHEFRVHVVDGEAIDITEKKVRNEIKDKADRLIRSHSNGWVHAHDLLSVNHPDDLASLRALAVKAISAVGLDFAAVDVLCTLSEGEPRRLKSAVVCEVNSAPGIENEITKNAYVAAFNKLIAKRTAQ
jgi:hypothetical protein